MTEQAFDKNPDNYKTPTKLKTNNTTIAQSQYINRESKQRNFSH